MLTLPAYGRGERCRTSKLTEARVRLIKERWRERPDGMSQGAFCRLMSHLHGISTSGVQQILYGYSWGWVE